MMVTARRARLTGMIMLAIAFMVGSLTGAAAIRVAEADGPKLMRGKSQERQQPDLLQRLELTQEQRVHVDAILERRRQEMEAFWEEHRPTLQGIADSARTEMRRVLTPGQQQVEAQFMEERRAHHERRERARRDRW
jgi:Spy/CpxP family protein refolding chaperone